MDNLDSQEFAYLNSFQQAEILENQRQIQLEKRMSISSIDEDLYESIQLPQIHNIKACLYEIQTQRDLVIAYILKNNQYLNSLNQTFDDLEDFEDTESLQIIYNIIRTLIFTCDISILETLLDDKHINLTLGAFECNYLISDDPCNTKNQKFRVFINEESQFQLEKLFDEDKQMRNIIIRNFRLQYLKDCVIAYQSDENLANAINSIVYYNNQEIVNYVMDQENFFTNLFQFYSMAKCVNFLEEFLNILKSMLQPEIKQRAVTILKYHDIFSKLIDYFIEQKEDTVMILKILNIFQSIMLMQPNAFVIYLINCSSQKQLFEALVQVCLEQEMGVLSTLLEFLKQMTEQIIQKKFQMLDFIFYQLIQPILQKLLQINKQKIFLLLDFICEILIFSVKNHGNKLNQGFKVRGFIISQKILQTLEEFLELKRKNFILPIVRLYKAILIQNDEVLIKYMHQNKIINPFIQIFLNLKNKNNIMFSCYLELFEFINKQNIKKIISAIFENFYNYPYKEPIWDKLKQKYESQADFNPTTQDVITEQQTETFEVVQIKPQEQKDTIFQRQLECEEDEMYFSDQNIKNEDIYENKIDMQRIKEFHNKMHFKKESDDEVIKDFTIKPQQKQKTSFSFSLNLDCDTIKKVKMNLLD